MRPVGRLASTAACRPHQLNTFTMDEMNEIRRRHEKRA